MADIDPWENLSLFESHDYIQAEYKHRHGGELNAARTKQIGSCFSQAREYFRSASAAANSVRPLLSYYGALALARGTVLFLDPTKNEEALAQSHGLERSPWGDTLANGIKNVLDIGVRATSGGAFTEFVDAAGNKQWTTWTTHSDIIGAPSLLSHFIVDYGRPTFLGDGSEVTLRDLLSRDPRLAELYRETTRQHPKCHVASLDPKIDRVAFQITLGAIPEPVPPVDQAYRAAFSIPDNVGLQLFGIPNTAAPCTFQYNYVGSDYEAIKKALPAFLHKGGDYVFALEDFANGMRLSELVRTFLIAYFLGMLVRYFPSRWMALLRNEKGDTAQPLLLKAMRVVDEDFPYLIWRTLH